MENFKSPVEHLVSYHQSLCEPPKYFFDVNSNFLTQNLFADLCELHHAGWKGMVLTGRKKRANISDEFEDILSFYLRTFLPMGFTVEQTPNKNGLNPDILIKKNGKNIFIIECKTTIGWKRDSPEKLFPGRIESLSENFEVPKQKIIFVFENHGNNGKNFSNLYWDKKLNEPKMLPKHFPYSQIIPLFNKPDPFYWTYERGFNKKEKFKVFTRENFLKMATTNTITKLENIISLIINS